MTLSARRKARARAGSRTDKSAAPTEEPEREAPGDGGPRRLAEAGWLAMVLVAPLALNPLAARPFEATKLATLAPLAALLCAALLAAAWRGKVLAATWRGAVSAAAPRAVLAALAGFFGVALLSTLASETPWTALFGSYLRREGLAAWLIAGLVCAAMLVLLRSRAQAERAFDALLLGSVVPCAYALLQVAGWVPGAAGFAWIRAGGTLGNPVFMADYLLLLIPLTLARLLQAGAAGPGDAWRARGIWLALLGLQAVAMLLTQSRAPLLALAGALWLFAALLAGIRRSRRLFGAAAAALLLVLGLLAALNLAPPLSAAARTVPGLARFVFAEGADPSRASRIGIWQAGLETLRAAPLLRQVIGYGPDSAHPHYFAHLPAAVLEIEGELDTIDRLHNDSMELAATLGIAGLLCLVGFIAALLRAAAGALAREEERAAQTSWWWFGALPLLAGGLGAGAAAGLSGSSGLAGVGLGIGLGVGWAIALTRVAWRAWSIAAPEPGAVQAGQILIAALAAALLGFWIDAQISLPVLATRVIFFALAGLLAVLAGSLRAPTAAPVEATPAAAARVAGWSAAIVAITACVAFVPAPFGQILSQPSVTGWVAQALLLLVPVAAAWGIFAAGTAPRRAATPAGSCWRVFALPLAQCALPFAAGYLGLNALQGLAGPEYQEQALGAPVLWAWLWLPCCCALLAWPPARAAAAVRPRLFPWVAAGLAAAALAGAWVELRADLLSKLAGVALAEGRDAAVPALLDRMARTLPGERRYRLTVGTRRLERVAAALDRGGLDAAPPAGLAEQLRIAEAEVRAGVAQAPADPWAVFALANVLQFEGMVALRPLIGAAGEAKAQEARRLFGQAHLLYPAQPVFLRNWAQVEFDLGDRAAAYRLLDRMEALQPAKEHSYAERVRMARQAGDQAVVEATLVRAAARLPPEALERVRNGISSPVTR